jgi:hypothetical protein
VVRRAGERHRAAGHHGDGQQQPERHCHGSDGVAPSLERE